MSEQGWSGVSAAAVGLLAEPVGAAVNDLILDMKHAAAGQSFLEWTRYRNAAELHTQLVAPEEMSDRRKLDALSRCATRIAITHSMPQSTAERLVDTAVALRDRLPRVSECLRDGLISPQQVKAIVERTDLVTDPVYQKMVDTDIADALRQNGSWSANRLRDMIDRIVFRADPAAVRRRRKAAVDARGFWMERGEDGMATVSATMTAEKAIALTRRVAALAACVCRNDPRTTQARRSDAHFCLVMGVPWECLCGNETCDAQPVPDETAPAHRDVPGTGGSTAVVHVICDLETAAGDGESPGFIDGYGVVSADHVRDIVDDPSTKIRPMGAEDNPLRPTQPADPYRPSSALDTFVRVRSLYCDIAGCNHPAWRCDLDHVEEYDHAHPERGGQTCPDGLGGKCRMHHNMKTFSEFVDIIDTDRNGRTETAIVTPEGLVVPGPAFTGDDLFPALRDIEFEHPTHAPPTRPPDPEPEPTRRRTRLEDKHARRRLTRAANQQLVDEEAQAADTAEAEMEAKLADDPHGIHGLRHVNPPNSPTTALDDVFGFDAEPPF